MELQKLNHSLAWQICQEIESDIEVFPEKDETSSADYVRYLFNNKHYIDCIHFLSFGLPSREAVWWAYACIVKIYSDHLNDEEKAAMQLIEKWVKELHEDSRYALEHINHSLHYKSPVGWAAQAGFWSGGSIVAKDKPKVSPDTKLCPKAVFGSIQLSVLKDPQGKEDYYQTCISVGKDIASGGNGYMVVSRGED